MPGLKYTDAYRFYHQVVSILPSTQIGVERALGGHTGGNRRIIQRWLTLGILARENNQLTIGYAGRLLLNNLNNNPPLVRLLEKSPLKPHKDKLETQIISPTREALIKRYKNKLLSLFRRFKLFS